MHRAAMAGVLGASSSLAAATPAAAAAAAPRGERNWSYYAAWNSRASRIGDLNHRLERPARPARPSVTAASSSRGSSTASPSKNKGAAGGAAKAGEDRVKMISTEAEFQAMLRDAGDKLVVVEYAESHSVNSKRIYPAMVELSRSCPEVVFRLILEDESDETKAMFRAAGIDKVPHFVFYKSGEKVHEEQGITEDMLLGDVLYYGDSSSIVQLHSRADVESLIRKQTGKGKLVVLDVGLKHCGPCVKVYPTVIKLAKQMADTVVFARMHGDENEDCMAFVKERNVVEVPTFLFIRDGEVCGRYVGSGKGELIGEILKHQGVM